ncbi:Uncharacterised protein [Mycobacteroides abscessus subsp. abscessus]|nr:Uncharacterised protein [Mycobacteroides abscessus subsp. abscessus]
MVLPSKRMNGRSGWSAARLAKIDPIVRLASGGRLMRPGAALIMPTASGAILATPFSKSEIPTTLVASPDIYFHPPLRVPTRVKTCSSTPYRSVANAMAAGTVSATFSLASDRSDTNPSPCNRRSQSNSGA